jgi:hypothetical protein
MKAAKFVLAMLMMPATASVASLAHASAPPVFVVTDKGASDRADDLVKRALALGDKDRYAEGEPLLREAWGLKHSYDIAANLAIFEAELGKWRDAAEHMTFALKNFPTSGKREHRGLGEQMLSKALPHVTALTITTNVDKAQVLVDGRSAGTAPLADVVFVDPGPHVLTATLAGYQPAQARVDARKGASQDVALTLLKEAAPPPTRRSVVPGAVLGGVAGAALVTGIGLFAAGRSKGASGTQLRDAILSVHHSCVMDAANYDARCTDVENSSTAANTLQKVGVGLMAGAGVAAVGTVIYFVLPPSSAGATSSGLRVSPLLSPSSGGLIFSGAF